jgi:heme exporter protein C
MDMSSLFHSLARPVVFARLSARILPVLIPLTVTLLAYGFYLALIASPPDYQQGETVRIMYIHVPCAWLSMGIYGLMALCSIFWFIYKHPLADLIARSAAPLGAAFTLIVLITGSLWGKPTWGAWWVWDARLTSVLILFFLYVGYISLTTVDFIDDKNRMAAAILSLVGAVNLPIIKFSVEWWNTLHQPASVIRLSGSTIDPSMLTPLLVMFAGLTGLFITCLLLRVQGALWQQKWRRMVLQSMRG